MSNHFSLILYKMLCLKWGLVINSPKNVLDLGSIPGTGIDIVAKVTTQNGGSLFLYPILSGRLKKVKDVDKWSSLSFGQGKVNHLRVWVVLVRSGWVK